MNIDEIIYDRQKFRKYKNFKEADRLRDLLDSELVFVFDHPENKQEVYYLTENCFRKKPTKVTHRDFLKKFVKADLSLTELLRSMM